MFFQSGDFAICPKCGLHNLLDGMETEIVGIHCAYCRLYSPILDWIIYGKSALALKVP